MMPEVSQADTYRWDSRDFASCRQRDFIEREWPILTLEIQPDHIHLFVTIPPSLPVADAVKILKGSTARKLFAAFPALKNQLYGGHLWSPSYYVGTAGTVSAQTIRHYIERTEHIKGRR